MSQTGTDARPQTANSAPATPLALDYELMRSTMIQWAQELAGDRWTNYNESDPGVTILEQLCFVLTELGLRAERPITEILASPQTQRLQLDRQGLYAAQDILPGPALTLLDQRRWLLDQIPEAANIWLTPRLEADHTPGLYEAVVLPRLPEAETCLCASDLDDLRQDLIQQVKNSAARLRNLGEDLAEVIVLTPQPLGLKAKLIIDNQRHPDEIQADLLFRLGLYLAPEPCRHSLEELLQTGLTPAEIFLGPPVERGFINDEELAAAIAQPCCHDLKEIIASTDGVLEVEDFEVFLQEEKSPLRQDKLEVKRGHFLQLQLDLNASPPPLQPYRDGQLVATNPARIQRLLKRHWQDHRQSFHVEQSYQQAFPPLLASTVEDGAYTSVQSLFPAVYGLSAASADSSLTPKRQGEIKQLKGYLLLFDQLMADCAAQIAFTRELLSPRAGGDRTYAYVPLRQVEGCDRELLIHAYEAKLAELHQRLDRREQRQALILDFFLALYGQNLLPVGAGGSDSADTDLQPLLQGKEELLQSVVPFSRERGNGVDYRDLARLGSPTPLERRCAIELRVRRSGGEAGAVVLETVAEKASFGRLLAAAASQRVRESFLTLDGLMAPLARGDQLDDRSNPFAGKTVATVLWSALANPRSYRIGGCDGGEDVDLVCLDSTGACWWLGSFSHARLAHAFAHRLLRWAGSQNDAVCLVEWVLLRHALLDAGAASWSPSLFQPRVSVVVMREELSPGQEETLARLLRPHLPAHLEMEVHIYPPRRFTRFLDLREAWLRSLAGEDPVRQARTSFRLAKFLRESSGSAPPAAPPTPPSPPPDPAAAAPQPAAPDPSPPLLPPAGAIEPHRSQQWQATPALAEGEGARCDNPVERSSLRLWRSAGLRFLLRPLPWQNQPGGGLSGEELDTVVREGLAVMPFQDPSGAAEGPSEALGQRHGEAAVDAAGRVGIPSGVVIWLAGVPQGLAADPAAPTAYLNRWAQTVSQAGFGTGLFLTATTPGNNLPFEWFCGWDPTVTPPMLGFGLQRDPASARQALVAGQGEILRTLRDRRGLTPPWLALDPRALPPTAP
jgi:hypothetical protein